MRAFIITLVTFFALAFAWTPNRGASQKALSSNDPELIHHADCGSSASDHVDDESYFIEVSIPPPRNYILGPPKFPGNAIGQILTPYCEEKFALANRTCAEACVANDPDDFCWGYVLFEATASGYPRLPWWTCYLLDVYTNTTDFVYDINANFAHAFNRVLLEDMTG